MRESLDYYSMESMLIQTCQVKWKRFTTAEGAEEYYIFITSRAETSFLTALSETSYLYSELLSQLNLKEEDSLVWTRFFVSDFDNQQEELFNSELYGKCKGKSVSIIGQTPFEGGKLSVLFYHVSGLRDKSFKKGTLKNYPLENYSILLSTNQVSENHKPVYDQTRFLFQDLCNDLKNHSLSLLENVVRTWIYVDDIDRNYKEMVEARRDLFLTEGLNPNTRYIASTGIEAKISHDKGVVMMDTLSIVGIREEQIIRLEAPGNMCPTIQYGITFERGTKLLFGDRAHYYISGTASIDTVGEVLFKNDVARQTRKAVENIEALLSPHHVSLNDFMYLIVYLRDMHDVRKVRAELNKFFPKEMPVLIVKGSVCRPSWLVEIEGVAIKVEKSDYLPFK